MYLTIVLDISPTFATLLEKIMATLADFTTKLDKLNADADAILKAVADLKAQLAAGGLTADEEAQVLSQLDALDAKLNPPAPPAPTP